VLLLREAHSAREKEQ